MIEEELKGKWFANTIFTTFDCFEKLCLMSKTARGNEVRDYVQTLRKFIDYYKDHINHKINDLAADHNYIYIILVNKGKNIFKVGITKNMIKRLYTYSTGLEKHPDIQFIMIIDNPKVVEKCVKTFGNNYLYKQGKELYKIDYDMLKTLSTQCGRMDHTFIGKKNSDVDAYIVYNNEKKPYSNVTLVHSKFKNDLSLNNNKVSKVGSKKVSKVGSKKVSKVGSKKVRK